MSRVMLPCHEIDPQILPRSHPIKQLYLARIPSGCATDDDPRHLVSIDPCIANDRGRSPVPRRNPPDPRIDCAKINRGDQERFRQQRLNFLPLPHPQGELRPIFPVLFSRSVNGRVISFIFIFVSRAFFQSFSGINSSIISVHLIILSFAPVF